MPIYGFICDDCGHNFDEMLSIENRERPLSENCPKCSKQKVRRSYDSFSQPIGSDTTLTPNKATGGRWNELMGRMKKGLAKRHHKNLDQASARTGRYWKG
jgi:putative FmdB family regulatory protein